MSFNTYADLIAEVPEWVQRTDLTARIPNGIVLAEAKMNRFFVQNANEIKDGAFSINAEYVNLPTGFGGVRDFYLNNNPKTPLVYLPSNLETKTFGAGSGKPFYYDIVAGQFRFSPPDGTYSATLIYFMSAPALTVANTTNWIMTAHSDAYLYGVVAEMFLMGKDTESFQIYSDRFYGVLREIVNAARETKWAAGMAVRVG